MKLKQITYKRRKIKVLWQECKDCLAVYDTNESTLTINPNLKGLMLGKIIYHELWHIICDLNKVDINKIGEEKTALLSEEYAIIKKGNPKLNKLIQRSLK
tara:strand:- start:1670 stop:1969 length:300 start_codon:yes stop_codon:yes gene_type:complete